MSRGITLEDWDANKRGEHRKRFVAEPDVDTVEDQDPGDWPNNYWDEPDNWGTD